MIRSTGKVGIQYLFILFSLLIIVELDVQLNETYNAEQLNIELSENNESEEKNEKSELEIDELFQISAHLIFKSDQYTSFRKYVLTLNFTKDIYSQIVLPPPEISHC